MGLLARLCAILLISIILAQPAFASPPCYDELDADAHSLEIAETIYQMDWMEYTCDAGAMGWAPAHTDISEWACEYATDSTYRWAYANGSSAANVTELGRSVVAEACETHDLSAGCVAFSSDWHSLQTAENAYYTDNNEYSCDLTGYWAPAHTDLSQWSCNSAGLGGYEWTFTSGVGEEYTLDETESVDCSDKWKCTADGFGGDTTEIDEVVDTNSVPHNLTLEVIGNGKVFWPAPVNVSGLNLTAMVVIGSNLVSVDTSEYGNLDKAANVTIYDLPYLRQPVVYRNGAACTTHCSHISYLGGDYTFGVNGFSNYTSGPNAALEIYDDNDAQGGSQGKDVGDNIYFFANYSNVTSGLPIDNTLGSCSITFSEAPAGPHAMSYNSTSRLWEYNRTFSGGPVSWSVSCTSPTYEPLALGDTLNFPSLLGTSAPSGVANITKFAEGRYEYSGGIANETTEGGNVTGYNLTGNESTEKWAGYYGNVTAWKVLGLDGSRLMYGWSWDALNGGEVCASTGTTFDWDSPAPVAGTDVDDVWGFDSSDSDSANMTLTTTANYYVAEHSGTTNGTYTYNGSRAGVWQTFVLGDGSGFAPGNKNGLAFCVNISGTQTAFTGDPHMFQLMVATNDAPSTYESYYFFLELD